MRRKGRRNGSAASGGLCKAQHGNYGGPYGLLMSDSHETTYVLFCDLCVSHSFYFTKHVSLYRNRVKLINIELCTCREPTFQLQREQPFLGNSVQQWGCDVTCCSTIVDWSKECPAEFSCCWTIFRLLPTVLINWNSNFDIVFTGTAINLIPILEWAIAQAHPNVHLLA